jgi:uncharacterized protein YcfJ
MTDNMRTRTRSGRQQGNRQSYNSSYSDVPQRSSNQNLRGHDAQRGNPQRMRNESFDDYDATSGGFATNKKKLIIGGAIAAAVLAAIGLGIIISNAGKVEIVSVQPALISAQQPYQSCEKVGSTHYSRNHKSGTEGAIIGGVGGAAVGGLVSHSWVGAGVGAAVGAVGGDLIERSNQPDYVAHHSSTTQCSTAYRPIQVPVGYQVGYLNSDNAVVQVVTQHQPQVGTKVKLEELNADQVSPQQQQQLVQQAINGGNATQPAAAGNVISAPAGNSAPAPQ